jgi:hypothetical protein
MAEVVEFNDSDEEELECEDTLVHDETPDDKKDLLWALTKPLDEMTLEEQLEAVKRIRELRKVRVASTKKKSTLDYLLAQLSPEKASAILKQLEDAMDSVKTANVEIKENMKEKENAPQTPPPQQQQ